MISNSTKHIVLICIILIFALTSMAYPDEILQNDSTDATIFHSPREFLEIMEKSDLVYTLNLDESLEISDTNLPIYLPGILYLDKSDEMNTLMEYELSDSARAIMDSGLLAAKDGDFEKAKDYYFRLMRAATDYHYSYTLIGDTYYLLRDYDSAAIWFRNAIELNPIDYNAYWFLADTYWDTEHKAEAVKELTLAHLCNRNHEMILTILKNYRAGAGKPWKDWSYEPCYKLERDSSGIKISCNSEWMTYAMVKAVWKYEPGYAREMTGHDYGDFSPNIMLEEKEALLNYLIVNDSLTSLWNIFMGDYLDEFLYYELIGKQYPQTLLIMPDDILNRIIEYINRYH